MDNLDPRQAYLKRLKAIIAEDQRKTEDKNAAPKEATEGYCKCCEDCGRQEDDQTGIDMADMVEEALLEGDQDDLINALATALMCASKECGWIDLSMVAHSIWVES